MSEIQRIVDQMDRAFDGDAWHGPPLKPMLDGLTAEDASKHPIQGVHSIWELVLHVTTWNTIVRDELLGASANVTAELDWPPVWEASDVQWRRAVQNLVDARSRLRKTVEGLRDEQLDERPAQRTSNTRYLMLHGVVQHDLYHAGQIAILKKALQARTEE
ncbi:MAG TPA: DinB family protein [Candidatus Acidoferrales bacterium]|nr:DinB family protein [Candidatus Acidoferrales bacterium]